MRLGMYNRLNMSHLNSGCNLFLHAAQLFVRLTIKILLDACALLVGDKNLSSRLNASNRARLDTRTRYRNSYNSSIFENLSLLSASSYFSAVFVDSLFSNILTSISELTLTPSAFNDATLLRVGEP